MTVPEPWVIAEDPRCGKTLRLASDADGADLFPTRAESEARAREAEAKAREAEGRAREAEAKAREAAEARIRELETELSRRGER
ncbi:MAG TPA: hypothetical protein VHE30_10425 [Polyangiaceae bacterium]|nr:hypothetical protein [Polyangiaceae bacterium]